MIVLWVVLVMIAVLAACFVIAIMLAWMAGEITSYVQERRQHPDFRQRKRIGRSRQREE